MFSIGYGYSAVVQRSPNGATVRDWLESWSLVSANHPPLRLSLQGSDYVGQLGCES